MEQSSWSDTASIIEEMTGLLAKREEARGIEEIMQMDAEIRNAVQMRSTDARQLLQEMQRSVSIAEQNVTPPSLEAHAEEMRTMEAEKENISSALQQMHGHIEDKTASLTQIDKELGEAEEGAPDVEAQKKIAAVPRVRHAVNLYQNITHISWKYDSPNIAGLIATPHSQSVVDFEIPVSKSEFEVADELWQMVEKATVAHI